MFKKDTGGKCPYCGSQDFVEVEELRPHRESVKCGNCDKYAVKHKNGTVYPLVDPEDKLSSPAPITR
jgi:predicted Zn finger-like uncharacterized protein